MADKDECDKRDKDKRATPKRSHSYTRSMRPAKFRINEQQQEEKESANQDGVQTSNEHEEQTEQEFSGTAGTPQAITNSQNGGGETHNDKSLDDYQAENKQSTNSVTTSTVTTTAADTNHADQDNEREPTATTTTAQCDSDEKESPDLSKIAKASIGNQFGRFQIGLSVDHGDEDSSSSNEDDCINYGVVDDGASGYDPRYYQMKHASHEDRQHMQSKGDDPIGDEAMLMDEEGYSVIRDARSDSNVSTTSSEGIMDEDEIVITRPIVGEGSPSIERPPIEIPGTKGATGLERQRSDSALIDPPNQRPSPESIERSLSLIKRRQSYKLSRRQSMSNPDLTKDPPLEENVVVDEIIPTQTERRSTIIRKNAVRRRSKENYVPKGRQTRAKSVISARNNLHPLDIPARKVDTPPALPRRNRGVIFADQLSPSEFSQELSPPINSLTSSNIYKYTSEYTSRPMKSKASKQIEVPPVGKQPKKLKLHCPRNAEKLRRYLKKNKYDQVERDQFDDTPLHSIVRSRRRDTHDLVMNLMVYSDFGTEEINSPARGQDTAIHLAIKNNDIFTVKILLAFGANINAKNAFGMTPLDVVNSMIAINPGSDKYRKIWILLLELDAKVGKDVHDTQEPMPRATADIGAIKQQFQNEANKEVSSSDLANELEKNMNQLLLQYEGIPDVDFQMALGLQQFELSGWNATASSPLHFQTHKGKRILFLDGGGIRGLIQMEILSLLEERTGEKIVDLFDWIVGTSTGGIVALGLVYGKKTLSEIRQFYFKMKDEVFAKTRFGFGSNTNTTLALEEILKETLTSDAKLSDISEPKVLVATVDKTTTRPRLIFFNNCLNNEFSKEYIWKVARYTSAAPMYFTELDGYIDGGILANNPSDDGLTVIQNYYQRLGERLDIAAIVSIGAGTFPAKELGCTDVHEMLLGMRILNIQQIQKRARNLMTLLSNALVGADNAVMNCRSRCQAQRIPFHRFSPNFNDITVEADETADVLLVDMLIETRRQAISQWMEEIEELVDVFKQVAAQRRSERLSRLRERRLRNQQGQTIRKNSDNIICSQ